MPAKSQKAIRNARYLKNGILLTIFGLLGLGIPYISIGILKENIYFNKFAKVNAQTQISTNYNFISSTGQSITSTTPTPDPNAPTVEDRLVMLGGKINMALIESQNQNVLWRGGWVYPFDSTPDKGGNTVIFGHRFRYIPPVTNTLYYLDKVKSGDEFYIMWKGKRYDYKVSEIKIINPDEVYVLNPSDKSEVTIITCFPLFSSAQRLVVVGDLI